MCVIIFKPAGVRLDPQLLENAIDYNKDGWGFVRRTPEGMIEVNRGMLSDRLDAVAYLKAHQEDELAFHARIGTAGEKDIENTHPFPIGPNSWLMHNGMLDIKGGKGEDHKSDTWVFADWLTLSIGGDYRKFSDPAVGGLLELYARSEHSKFLIMAPDKTRLYNAAAGIEKFDCWFSNSTAFASSKYYGGYGVSNYWDEKAWPENQFWNKALNSGNDVVIEGVIAEEDKISLATVEDMIEFFLLLDLSDIGKLPYEEPESVARVLAERHEGYEAISAEYDVLQDPERAARDLLNVLDKHERSRLLSSLT